MIDLRQDLLYPLVEIRWKRMNPEGPLGTQHVGLIRSYAEHNAAISVLSLTNTHHLYDFGTVSCVIRVDDFISFWSGNFRLSGATLPLFFLFFRSTER